MYLTSYLSWISRSLRCASATLSAVMSRISWRSMKIGIAASWPRPTPQSGRWPDILIDPEKVVRVVPGLDCGQSLGVAEIGVGDPVLLFFRHEVDVDASRRERFARLEHGSRPGDAGSVIRGVAPPRVDVKHEADVAVRVGRRLRRYLIDRTAQLSAHQLAFRRRKSPGKLDQCVNHPVAEGRERVRLPVVACAGSQQGIENGLPADEGMRPDHVGNRPAN